MHAGGAEGLMHWTGADGVDTQPAATSGNIITQSINLGSFIG
ncbi:hypothetical protein DCF40_12270 [Edwardsiella piscicida]|nr:hypothetical protein A9797_18290 [Edwardsiella piscicida]UCQ59310.1 hypothetical protein DCF40_12270 [Edwardsiella piscicida]